MGQEEVISIMAKLNRPLARAEIATELGKDPTKVSHIIARLIETNQIKFKEINREEANKLLDHKVPRRIRLYFIPKEK